MIFRALVLAVPVMLPLLAISAPPSLHGTGTSAWLWLACVSVFSMLIGFVFWYHELAIGGIARNGQLQLLQPFFGLALAAWWLREPVAHRTPHTAHRMPVVTGCVVACVAFARRCA